MAVKLDDLQEWVARNRGSLRYTIGCVAATIGSLVLLGLHWSTWAVFGGAPHFQTVTKSLEYVGAAGLVLVAVVWTPAIRLLSTRLIRRLGRISFSLYLVHVPIIIAVASLFGRQQPALRLAVSAIAALVVAHLFARFIEEPVHRLSRRAGRLVARSMHGWFDRDADPRPAGRVDS